jgi:hypothetical protein
VTIVPKEAIQAVATDKRGHGQVAGFCGLRLFNPLGAAQFQHQNYQNLEVGDAIGEHNGPRVPQESVDEPKAHSGSEKREHQPGERMPPCTPGANYLGQKGDSRQGARTITDQLGLIA